MTGNWLRRAFSLANLAISKCPFYQLTLLASQLGQFLFTLADIFSLIGISHHCGYLVSCGLGKAGCDLPLDAFCWVVRLLLLLLSASSSSSLSMDGRWWGWTGSSIIFAPVPAFVVRTSRVSTADSTSLTENRRVIDNDKNREKDKDKD